MSDISELRSYERFVIDQRTVGSFGSAEIVIVNLGVQGAQIEHSQPLRVATQARLWFKHAGVAISVQALVVWSRLAKSASVQGMLYRSGLRIEEGADEFAAAMEKLLAAGSIHRDAESLERKRKLKEEREMKKIPVMRTVKIDDSVPSHQALLVTHARERLRTNPDEAQKWYSRAYFALKEGKVQAMYTEEALAIWEYLERSIPLATIAKALEKKKS
jgi:hypothetical protein